METCKTCRWWGVGQQDVPYATSLPPNWDRVASEAKRCGSPNLIDINDHKEGYVAVKGNLFGLDYPVCDLVTGPDFGCVHYEASLDAHCPDGKPCEAEAEDGHPCDRDEQGQYICRRMQPRG